MRLHSLSLKASTLSNLLYYFFGRPECVGNSLAYVAHFVFLRDV
jgi:hypothetical protein